MLRKDFEIIKKIILLIIFQSALYLLAKLSPFNVHLLTSEYDSKIPFVSQFIYFYVSWYLMLFLVPYLLSKKDNIIFKKYISSAVISIVVVSIIYFFFPTTILRGAINSNGLSNYITNIIYLIDTPILNCFPSMHCLLCFLYIYYTVSCKKFSCKYKILIIRLKKL